MTDFNETESNEEIGIILPEEDNDAEERIEKVMKLTRQSDILDYAKNDKNPEVRLTAIHRLTEAGRLSEQTVIADIARNDSSPEVREAAVSKTENQGVLADIGKNDLSVKVRLAAVGKLSDQQALTEIALGDRSVDVCRAAAAKVTDMDKLREIATGSVHKDKLVIPAIKGPYAMPARGLLVSKPKANLTGNNIIGIIIDLVMIIGGLSGTLVLRGTNSSMALVVLGFGLLIWNIIKISNRGSDSDSAWVTHQDVNTRKEMMVISQQGELRAPVTVTVSAKCGSLGSIDIGARLNGKDMKRDKKNSCYTLSTDRVHSILTFKGLDLAAAFDIDNNASSELTLELYIENRAVGIKLPEGVTLIQNG